MIRLQHHRNRFQVFNIVQGTGRNYQGLCVSTGTKGRRAKERYLWFPKAKPEDLVNKAAWLLKHALDRGFMPSEAVDEPALFQMEQTPVHPFLQEALTEARNRPAKSHIQVCKAGLQTRCPVCDETIGKDQTAALCTEKTSQGLIAYLVCKVCCRELE
ncbi:MAG: hypothetical protein QNK37_29285 [Acidobacteriota bacterium]|nr:hypothetical protein [Acidobacteriota bacterium]